MINGVKDYKGINEAKLEHLFLGSIKSNNVSGFHHEYYEYNDTVCKTLEGRIYTSFYRFKGVYKAIVVNKVASTVKSENHGQSTFFPINWSRQEVVNCIARSKKAYKVIDRFGNEVNIHHNSVRNDLFQDKATNIVMFKKQVIYPIYDLKGINRKRHIK